MTVYVPVHTHVAQKTASLRLVGVTTVAQVEELIAGVDAARDVKGTILVLGGGAGSMAAALGRQMGRLGTTRVVAVVPEEAGGDELAAMLSQAVPAGQEEQIIELMARSGHPAAEPALSALGRRHPNQAVQDRDARIAATARTGASSVSLRLINSSSSIGSSSNSLSPSASWLD